MVPFSCLSAASDAEILIRHRFADKTLRRDVTAVCNNVAGILQRRIGRPPALGTKPFVIQQAPDGKPRAVLNGLPREYVINITSLDSRDYCKITYQLAHELGHYYVDPNRSNWFIESTVTALSLVALSDMGDTWACTPPFPNWKSWAHCFQEYRDHTLGGMLEQIHVKPDEDSVTEWLRTKAPALLHNGSFDRPHQHACALVIESMLKRHASGLAAITALGAATSGAGITGFKKWEELVNDEERPLVKELAALFAPLMGTQSGK